MTRIKDAINEINTMLPPETRLVAVSKYHDVADISEAYSAGQRIFGESHVQELLLKKPQLPQDIEWHFIGHLQTNKVKYIAPFISMIHAVDSEKLLAEIHRQAMRCNRRIPCLLQLHVAQEETKFGFTQQECIRFLESGVWQQYTHAAISGMMCMASNVDDENQIEAEFERAYRFFNEVKEKYFHESAEFVECSWGMSDDYVLAMRHGSTFVRIGSKIFGPRQ